VLNAGTVTHLVVFLIYAAIAYWATKAARGGRYFPLKKLAGLDAIEECNGRATELGRPFQCTIDNGGAQLEDQVMATFELVRFAAASAVRYEAPFMVVSNSPEGHPIFEEIVSTAYVAGGKADLYRPDMVRFIGGYSSATHVQIMQLMRDQKIAAQLIAGNLMNQTMFYAETGAALGAIQIGATKNTHQMPFIAMQCDYTLMGDELYAAATMISRDPLRMGILVAQEGGKLFCLVIIIAGVIFRLAGSTALVDILTK